MRLELADFPVREISFGKETRYQRGVLVVNRDELRALILEDHRVKDVQFELVAPNEDCRITEVCDVIEPRIKVEGPGVVFPGIMGPVDTVGSGKTNSLSNLAVVPSAEIPTISKESTLRIGGVALDMSGPGALTPISSGHVLALVLELEPGSSELDYHQAIQLAEMKVAHHLAKATVKETPENVEVFDSPHPSTSLPKVVYIQPVPSFAWQDHPGPAIYGLPVREVFPTPLHPNELFDGALTHSTTAGSGIGSFPGNTWRAMNHEVLRRLYWEHGKHLNFVGVIFERIRFESYAYKQMTSNMTANAAQLMGAQGAIVPGIGIGSNQGIDIAHTVQALEQRGIKTVLMTQEAAGPMGREGPLGYCLPEMISMVSLGNSAAFPKPGKVKRVVGAKEMVLNESKTGVKALNAYGELDFVGLVGKSSSWGFRNDICYEY